MKVKLGFVPPLDPDFQPAVLWNRQYVEAAKALGKVTPLVLGLDLTPLLADESLGIVEYVCGFVDKLEADVRQKLGRRLGRT